MVPGTHSISDWVGLRTGLDAVTKIKIPCLESSPGHPTRTVLTVFLVRGWSEEQLSRLSNNTWTFEYAATEVTLCTLLKFYIVFK